MEYKVRTVGDLKKALADFPDDMLVMSGDGMADAGKVAVQECQVYPPVRRKGPYTEVLSGGGFTMPCERVCDIGSPDED